MDLISIKDAILDILYPQNMACLVCEKRCKDLDKMGLCEECSSSLPFLTSPLCYKCGRPVEEETKLCHHCIQTPYCFKQAVSVFEYTPSIQQFIYRYKYRGISFLSGIMGLWMAETLTRCSTWDIDIIIPVPLHKRRERKRGFNQAVLLAKEIGKNTGKEVAQHILIRSKDTPTQVGLDKFQRMWNLWDAFQVRQPDALKGKTVLLVDDVFTTGSTAHHCSRVLLGAGAKQIYVLTLATVRHV